MVGAMGALTVWGALMVGATGTLATGGAVVEPVGKRGKVEVHSISGMASC